jgi:hypothetical protein
VVINHHDRPFFFELELGATYQEHQAELLLICSAPLSRMIFARLCSTSTPPAFSVGTFRLFLQLNRGLRIRLIPCGVPSAREFNATLQVARKSTCDSLLQDMQYDRLLTSIVLHVTSAKFTPESPTVLPRPVSFSSSLVYPSFKPFDQLPSVPYPRSRLEVIFQVDSTFHTHAPSPFSLAVHALPAVVIPFQRSHLNLPPNVIRASMDFLRMSLTSLFQSPNALALPSWVILYITLFP